MDLGARTHWIFDMDGTLTVPQHDFAWLRAQLEIPEGEDILQAIDARDPQRAAEDHAFIHRWEEAIAHGAKPQADALALLSALRARGCTLGVLTRNTLLGARITLQAAGLEGYFAPDAVLGRGCAPPKPLPGGVEALLSRWGAPPTDAVMVGDWIHDVEAGRAAGAATVLIRRHGPNPWDDVADLTVDTLTDPRVLGG